jgi:hypothetical protein
MIMGSQLYGARFGTALANVGDLNLDGYEGKLWSHRMRIHPEFNKAIAVANEISLLRFEVLTAVIMKSTISWDITPCSLLKVNRYLRGIYIVSSSGSKNKPSKKPA